MLLGSLFMPEREEAARGRASTGSVSCCSPRRWPACSPALSNGQREGWHSDYILDPVRGRRARGSGFLVWELHTPQPLVELRVLANGQFTCAATRRLHLRRGPVRSTYLVPLFVQTVQSYTPLAAGLLLMPAGLILGLFMPIGGYLSDRMPARRLIVAGLLCFALSRVLAGAASMSTRRSG